jgi:sulfide:quinone oxidoreductase
VNLAHAAGANFTLGALASVDTDRHLARTTAGAEFAYDVLLVASGATPVPAVPGAFTFRGPADSSALSDLLAKVMSGTFRHVAFGVPGGVTWPLPIYELALLTTSFLAARGVEDVEFALVTPEDAPLALFGSAASTAASGLLEERGVRVYVGSYPISADDGVLTLAPSGAIAADVVVALPRLRGEPIDGIPHDADGFVPTDPSGRVRGVEDVFAAGDVTAFPVKQGGLAAQQAQAAAEAVAAQAGADLTPQPFRPVLRGLLLTGAVPTYLRAELGGGAGDTSAVQAEPLWWPPGKIVGRYLAPFLSEWAGVVLAPPTEAEALPVEVDLSSAFNADHSPTSWSRHVSIAGE